MIDGQVSGVSTRALFELAGEALVRVLNSEEQLRSSASCIGDEVSIIVYPSPLEIIDGCPMAARIQDALGLPVYLRANDKVKRTAADMSNSTHALMSLQLMKHNRWLAVRLQKQLEELMDD